MKTLLTLILCSLLMACSHAQVEDYRDQQPALDLREYFTGRTDAWGMFQDRSGKVINRFHVLIEGRMEGAQLVLDEHFTYSDGSTRQRIWRLREISPGQWRGSAGDVLGEAIGEVAGNALRWRYDLLLPVDGSVYQVHFDDWMYLLDAQTLINRSFMSKLGVELGQVTLFFRKQD